MEVRCDYCGIEQALVYCESDLAKLCLNCDVFVHSANSLSLKHMRSLLCEKCYSQPAFIHCLDDKVSLCQGCQWTATNCSCSSLGHKIQSLNPYSGSPSPTDYAKIWHSILEPSVSKSVSAFDDCTKMKKLEDWDGLSSSMVTQTQNPKDNPSFFSMESNLAEKGCSGLDLCEGINMDDLPLNFNASDDIIGCSSLDHTESYQYNEDSLEEDKNIGLPSLLLPALSGNVVPSLSLSMSNITGESSATDYQDCGISPGFLIGDSPWESNVEVSFSPKSRDEAKKRYNQKKSKRKFGKQIRYASRKARADTRKRVKGRFVKSGETFEYDPSLMMN